MTKKMMFIAAMAFALLLVGVPILNSKFGIPQETTNTVLGFISGFVGRMGFDKVRQVRREKKASQQKEGP